MRFRCITGTLAFASMVPQVVRRAWKSTRSPAALVAQLPVAVRP
ncbi:MAG: hypothetical protein ACKOF7_10995 [Phycisphaerales bacterium]